MHIVQLPNCHVGFPQLDKGTENSLIAQCQVAFTMCHKDEQQSSMSVQYGSSPADNSHGTATIIKFILL